MSCDPLIRGEVLVNVFGVPFFLRMQALGAKLIPDLQLIPRYQEKMSKKYLKNAIFSDPKNAF